LSSNRGRFHLHRDDRHHLLHHLYQVVVVCFGLARTELRYACSSSSPPRPSIVFLLPDACMSCFLCATTYQLLAPSGFRAAGSSAREPRLRARTRTRTASRPTAPRRLAASAMAALPLPKRSIGSKNRAGLSASVPLTKSSLVLAFSGMMMMMSSVGFSSWTHYSDTYSHKQLP
jgi:hypothetical protein